MVNNIGKGPSNPGPFRELDNLQEMTVKSRIRSRGKGGVERVVTDLTKDLDTVQVKERIRDASALSGKSKLTRGEKKTLKSTVKKLGLKDQEKKILATQNALLGNIKQKSNIKSVVYSMGAYSSAMVRYKTDIRMQESNPLNAVPVFLESMDSFHTQIEGTKGQVVESYREYAVSFLLDIRDELNVLQEDGGLDGDIVSTYLEDLKEIWKGAKGAQDIADPADSVIDEIVADIPKLMARLEAVKDA